MFVGLSAILMVWSWAALRDRPIRQYAIIYVLTAALGCVAECSTLGILYPFETHVFVFSDPYRDLFLTEVIVKLVMFPLIGCLFVRYAGQQPIWVAGIAAGLLGMTERLFVHTGAMVYFRWNTIFTVLLFFVLFLFLRWFIHQPIPLWVDAGAAAFVAAYITHQLAGGVFLLFKYRLPLPVYSTDSLFLVLKNGLLVGPSALAVSLIPRLRNPVGVLLAAGLNVLVNEWFRWSGILVYTGWNPWLGALRYLIVIGITMAYTLWQMEERTGPMVLERHRLR